jgi:hypothetical protein
LALTYLFVESNKHEYNTVKKATHRASCLLTGEEKLVMRKPDATFGLAVSRPSDYQRSVLADWSLDHERLEALLLHRQCGLISDPRWGDANLVFPFTVYEAKGWDGDPREARQQACSAGAVYFDMLESLAKRPGRAEGRAGDAYQMVGKPEYPGFLVHFFRRALAHSGRLQAAETKEGARRSARNEQISLHFPAHLERRGRD